MVTRCIRFWIDEPPERVLALRDACDEMRDAYNAMLEEFEVSVRAEVVAESEAAKEAWIAWKRAEPPARGEKPRSPKKFALSRHAQSLVRVGKVAVKTTKSRAVALMFSSEFARDVDAYMARRIWSHENHGIRRRGEPMPVPLCRSSCHWDIGEDAEGVWAILPLRADSVEGAREMNRQRWALAALDGRKKTWTLALLREALTEGEVGGCKIIPPKRGAPAGKRRFMLAVTVQTPAQERNGNFGVLDRVAGVDLGVNQFAVYSCPDRRSIVTFAARDLQGSIERRRKQLRGVPRKRSMVIGEAIGRRMDAFCRLVARRLVDQCIRDGVTELKFEDLKGIRESAGEDPDRQFMLGARFPYFKLQTYVEQAAQKVVGLKIKWINPAGTSQTCSFCGHRDPASRVGRRFVCVKCGFNRDADVNAANNIAASRRVVRASSGPADAVTQLGCDHAGAPDSTGEALEAAAV
jgi:hypothetical protein